MDKLVRRIEVPLAEYAVEAAGLYIAKPEDMRRLAEVAMEAYREYPLHRWMCGGEYDEKTSLILMQASISSMVKDCVIYADSPELNGFAAWYPFGFKGTKTLPFLMHGGMKLLCRGGPSLINKLLTYESFAMNLKKKYTGNADWYLFNLSVSPKAQGKGIATKLLRPMLDFCDNEKMVAYLETNKESNVHLYKHFEFDVAEEAPVPHSDVMHYAMIRQPQPINGEIEE